MKTNKYAFSLIIVAALVMGAAAFAFIFLVEAHVMPTAAEQAQIDTTVSAELRDRYGLLNPRRLAHGYRVSKSGDVKQGHFRYVVPTGSGHRTVVAKWRLENGKCLLVKVEFW